MTTRLAKSPLRYPGGKSKALKQILPLIPADIAEFREPFVGGGSVFLAIRSLFQRRIRRYWINDLNYDLYCFWKCAQRDNDALIAEIRALKRRYNDGHELHTLMKEHYGASDFQRAVRFFILNRITFSGTVDSGGYSQQAFEKRFTDSSIERLSRVAPYLSDVTITHGDYESLLMAEGERVFLFMDPPYFSATDSRLYGTNGSLHSGFDHERFAQTVAQCPHRYLITYDDSPHIRALFHYAQLSEWVLQYGMNNYMQTTAAKGNEIFVRNYDRS